MNNYGRRCPFSKGACRDCSVYRGRHYYLCFGGTRRTDELCVWRETSGYRPDVPYRIREIPRFPVLEGGVGWLSDLEDCIEGR